MSEIMTTTRRGFLFVLGATLAVIPAASLMKLWVPPRVSWGALLNQNSLKLAGWTSGRPVVQTMLLESVARYSVGVGLRSQAECLPCGVNYYSPPGATACVLCSSVSANSWSGAGAGVCMPNAGYYDLGKSLMAYYPFNNGNALADVSAVTGSLTTSASSPTFQSSGPFGDG